jgi:EpsD family peptidyl-prolyl cis-trans isomerase
LLCLLAALPFLCSCGRPAPQERLAATVNEAFITVEDVRASMAAVPETAQAKPGVALDSLIDSELLAQRAETNKLDRYPEVARALRAARRQVLAQAYIRQLIASASGEDKQAIRAYYQDHPQLFAKRRTYRVFEIAVSAAAVDVGKLKEKARSSRYLSEIADWLNERDVRFLVGAKTDPAEQVPAEFLPRLASMRDGEMQVWESGGRVSVIQLLQSTSAPLSEEDALPLIERYLLASNRFEALATTLKNLRAGASIDYVLDFDGTHSKKDEAAPDLPMMF